MSVRNKEKIPRSKGRNPKIDMASDGFRYFDLDFGFASDFDIEILDLLIHVFHSSQGT